MEVRQTEDSVTTEAEVDVMQPHKPRNDSCHQKLEAASTDSLLEPPEGARPCYNLMSSH